MSAGGGVRCMLMRGGTSKGAYFLAEGQLGLDLYGLRDKLAARGVEYVAAGQEEGDGG